MDTTVGGVANMTPSTVVLEQNEFWGGSKTSPCNLIELKR